MTLLLISAVLVLIIFSTDVLTIRSTIGRGRRPVTSRIELIGNCLTATALLIAGHQLVAWPVITVLPWFLLVALTAATIGVSCTRADQFPWLPTDRPIRTITTTSVGAILSVALAALLTT